MTSFTEPTPAKRGAKGNNAVWWALGIVAAIFVIGYLAYGSFYDDGPYRTTDEITTTP